MSESKAIELPNIQAEYIYMERLRCEVCGAHVKADRRGSRPGSNNRMEDIWDVHCPDCHHIDVVILSVPMMDIMSLFGGLGKTDTDEFLKEEQSKPASAKSPSLSFLMGQPALPDVKLPPQPAKRTSDEPGKLKKILSRLTHVGSDWAAPAKTEPTKSSGVKSPSTAAQNPRIGDILASAALTQQATRPAAKPPMFPDATKNFRELSFLIDKKFVDRWMEVAGAQIPDTASMNGEIVSMIAQLGVMAVLEENSLVPPNREQALDFAMKFVETMWPFIPFGAQQRFGLEKWQALHYQKWNEAQTVWHNLHVETARLSFKQALVEELAKFPGLSTEDKERITESSPSTKHLSSYLTTEEGELAKELGFSFFEAFLQIECEKVLGSIPAGTDMLPLYEGLSGQLFANLQSQSPSLSPRFQAHRAKFAQPPRAAHSDTFNNVFSDPRLSQICQMKLGRKDFSTTDREKLLKITFPISYEAAYQLFTDDTLLTLLSGRDSRSRDQSGFSFWNDLIASAVPPVAENALKALELWYKAIFQEVDSDQMAQIFSWSPISIFLELIRLEIRRTA